MGKKKIQSRYSQNWLFSSHDLLKQTFFFLLLFWQWLGSSDMSGGFSSENYGGESSQDVHQSQQSGPHAQPRVSVRSRF